MTDTLNTVERSQRMSRVRSKDTKPEMLVRRLIYAAGYRYRLHDKALPGKPDMVFRGRRKLVFVNGCFWHRHENCVLARLPKSNQDFWLEKLSKNKFRDEKNYEILRKSGWDVLIIWECQLRNLEILRDRITNFLNN